jgi:Na+/melibiose symporter-like transporter
MNTMRNEEKKAWPITAQSLLLISLYWLPFNLFWTVMRTSLIPRRVEEFGQGANDGAFMTQMWLLGGIATTVIQLIVGPISDSFASKFGRRKPFLLWGTLGTVLSMVLFGAAGNFGLLLTAFFALQLFINIASGPYQALIPDNIPENRHGLASSYMGVALLIGQLAGAFSLFLIKPYGNTGPLVLAGVLLIIAMAITLQFVPDLPAPKADQKPWLQTLSELKHLGLRNYPNFVGLLISRFFINLTYSTVATYLHSYLKDAIGLGAAADEKMTPILLVVTVFGLLGTVIAGRLADRMPKKNLIFIACGILAVAVIVFGLAPNFTVVLALAAVFGVGWGICASVDWALACNLLPKGQGTAKYMAIWHACMTLPDMLGPAIGKAADPINARYGHGMGWRVAMLSTVIYLVIGAIRLRSVKENMIEGSIL